MSYVVGQNSLTPKDKQNSLTSYGNNNMNFRLACDQVVLLETTALRVSGKQNSLFPLVPVIECLLFHKNYMYTSLLPLKEFMI